jgi:ATP-dependent DNA ligase
MNLLVSPPIADVRQESRRTARGDPWIFEPTWDGFRTLIFQDGEEVLIQSRDEKSLNCYFLELIERLRAQLPKH